MRVMARMRTTINRVRAEDGFSLVELLVAMVAGVVVLSALFTILDVTSHQTTRTLTKVDATQRARTTFESIANELHSACLTDGITPIQTGSGDSSLSFASAYGNAASPTPVEHQLTFSSSSGTLTDTTYAVASGTAPNWTFSTTASSTTTLLTNVSQSGTTPVFQYFAYQEPMNGGSPYTDGAGNAYEMLLDGTNAVPGTSTIPAADPLTTPLSSTDASSAAEVIITLVVGAGGGTGENTNLATANQTVSNSIILRLTPVANHVASGNTFDPCD